MLINAPSQEEITSKLKTLLKDKVIIAFNSSFDKGVCERTFGAWIGNNQWQCAMKMAANAFGSGSGRISFANACKAAGVRLTNAHDAEADTRATVELLYAMGMD